MTSPNFNETTDHLQGKGGGGGGFVRVGGGGQKGKTAHRGEEQNFSTGGSKIVPTLKKKNVSFCGGEVEKGHRTSPMREIRAGKTVITPPLGVVAPGRRIDPWEKWKKFQGGERKRKGGESFAGGTERPLPRKKK